MNGQRYSGTMIVDHNAKTILFGTRFGSAEITWGSLPYDVVGIDMPAGGGYYISDFESYAAEFNLSRLPDRTIAGRVCRAYTGIDPEDGTRVTLAFWNGVMMFAETEDGAMRAEAQAVTFDVPASAFTQTMNITWIQ